MKRRLVIYHAPCLDGTTAAWAAWRAFGDSDTEYLPAKYGDPPPMDVAGRDVIVLDFSYSRADMLAMYHDARTLLVLDHHKSAEIALKDLPFAVFDMSRSGAGMAWDTFHSTPRPWLVDYVEDRDLWRFRLPDSKAVNAWIHASPRETFEQWDALDAIPALLAAEKGEAVLAYQAQYVREMVKQARPIMFCGHAVPVVNAPYFSISELLSALAEGNPFAVGWCQRPSGLYQYSLRSRGDFDVSLVAQKFGGGGHKNAAGFTSNKMPDHQDFR